MESIVPLDGDFSAFNVTDATGESYTARKIVLGTGLRDLLPSTPGLREAFGKGIFWCPWCDGYGEFSTKDGKYHTSKIFLTVYRAPRSAFRHCR